MSKAVFAKSRILKLSGSEFDADMPVTEKTRH